MCCAWMTGDHGRLRLLARLRQHVLRRGGELAAAERRRGVVDVRNALRLLLKCGDSAEYRGKQRG